LPNRAVELTVAVKILPECKAMCVVRWSGIFHKSFRN